MELFTEDKEQQIKNLGSNQYSLMISRMHVTFIAFASHPC